MIFQAGAAARLDVSVLAAGDASHGRRGVVLILYDRDTGKDSLRTALGPKGRDVKKFLLNPGEGVAGWVAMHRPFPDRQRHRHRLPFLRRNLEIHRLPDLFDPRGSHARPRRDRGSHRDLNKKQKKYFTQDDLRWLEIFAVQAALAIENARFLEKAQEEIHYLRDKVQAEQGWHNLIAKSPLIVEKLDLIARVAKTESSVLILGESGVGKELFAEQVHLKSARAGKPFVRVNCAALPEGLLESELFGARQGRLHRRRAEPEGPLRAGRHRHHLPRRDRGLAVEAAGEASQGAPAAGTSRRSGQRARQRRRADRGRDQQGYREARRKRRVSLRPVLSAQRAAPERAAPPAAQRGHTRLGRLLPQEIFARDEQAICRLHRDGDGAHALLFMAGQRARARERGRAGRRHREGYPHRRPRPPARRRALPIPTNTRARASRRRSPSSNGISS